MMESELRSFHDGNVLGFLLLQDNGCNVFVINVKEQKYEIVLKNVFRLRSDNFLEGNIILDITLESGTDIPRENVLYALSLESGQFPEFVDGVMTKIANGDLCLFEINPSYGCSFACLCSSIEIKPVQD